MTQASPKKQQPAPGQAPRPVPIVPGTGAQPVAHTPAAARPAPVKRRHRLLFLSFLVLVLVPIALTSWYLWTRAADEYVSRMGFSVHREDTSSAVDILGGLSAISGSSSKDMDILYKFIHGQEIVSNIDKRLNLRALYARPYQQDPIFAFNPKGKIEDLVAYWRRMVKISYNSTSGMIELEVLAFDPVTAHDIAQSIYDESSRMINALSTIARKDTIRYSHADLEEAMKRLKEARAAITEFRARNQMIDPSADIQAQMGLLNTLQSQQATALVDLDLLRKTTRPNDPRIAQAERKISVIEERIAQERRKFGTGAASATTQDLATLTTEFERLTVDREFAERAYTAALTAYDLALAKAQRQSRYLTAYITPTLAESPQYPHRWTLLGLVGLFLFLAWAIAVLIFYSVRDRR